MPRPNRNNVPSGEDRQFALTKLSISLVIVFLARWAFSLVFELYIVDVAPRSPNLFGLVAQLAYGGTGLFVLVEMLAVLWVYRPIVSLFRVRSTRPEGMRLLYDLLVGMGAGLVVFALTIPLLWGAKTRLFINTIFPSIRPIEVRSVLYILLFGLALPVATELVFRGIVLRTLEAHISSVAAVVVSALLFAILWPIFNFVIAAVLGIMTGTLYRWRRSVVPAIVANAVMTISAGTYVVALIWRS